MISYNLTEIKTAEYLVNVCRYFAEDIDVMYQRQVIDGKSMLGVMSLIGHTVTIVVHTDDPHVVDAFKLKLYQ